MTEAESSGSWPAASRKVKKVNKFSRRGSTELAETDPIPNFSLHRRLTELGSRRKVTIFRHRTPN
jgi:hypothetical protein